MIKSIRVLVTGSGSVYGLGIISALRQSVLPIEILAIDTNPYALGLFIADRGFIAPPVTPEESYFAFIRNLCQAYRINAIFIGSGAELGFYSSKRDLLEHLTGAKVFVSSPGVTKLCSDKWLTMRYLFCFGHQIPHTIRYPEDTNMLPSYLRRTEFPLIVKPRVGRGSEGVTLVKNRQQLLNHVRRKKNLIIQEYISGEDQEYTVGICVGHRGKIISQVALKRYLQEGISIAAISDDYREIAEYCARVAGTLRAYGAINVQLRLRDGEPVIFEINPRFSSSTGMRLLVGINEPESLIRSEVLGQQVMPGLPKPGLVLRQYTDYYFPFDRLEHFLNI